MHWKDLARRQHAMVARRQLLAIGLSAPAVDHLRHSGRLDTTRWPGVYRAAGAPLTPIAAQWGAVLDADGILSYLSASSWWDVPVPDDGRVHVTVEDRRRTCMPRGVRIHRVALADDAWTVRFGMRVTTKVETILDCLGWLPWPESTRLADRSLQQGWLCTADIDRRLLEQPGRWGNRRLAALRRLTESGARAESERLLLALLREAGIVGWIANAPVLAGGHRYLLDVAFPHLRLAIEVDGWAYHSTPERFRADRSRQNALVAEGWTVLRFTWWDLTERPEQIVATLARFWQSQAG